MSIFRDDFKLLDLVIRTSLGLFSFISLPFDVNVDFKLSQPYSQWGIQLWTLWAIISNIRRENNDWAEKIIDEKTVCVHCIEIKLFKRLRYMSIDVLYVWINRQWGCGKFSKRNLGFPSEISRLTGNRKFRYFFKMYRYFLGGGKVKNVNLFLQRWFESFLFISFAFGEVFDEACAIGHRWCVNDERRS